MNDVGQLTETSQAHRTVDGTFHPESIRLAYEGIIDRRDRCGDLQVISFFHMCLVLLCISAMLKPVRATPMRQTADPKEKRNNKLLRLRLGVCSLRMIGIGKANMTKSRTIFEVVMEMLKAPRLKHVHSWGSTTAQYLSSGKHAKLNAISRLIIQSATTTMMPSRSLRKPAMEKTRWYRSSTDIFVVPKLRIMKWPKPKTDC